MARTGRISSDMGVYHVLLRGMNELFSRERDYTEFINILKKYASSGVINVFSYNLLKNRIHLVVSVKTGIGTALKPLCTSYARYFNRTYHREGKLFYDRLKSEPINTKGELKNVVAFVNSITGLENHSSISPSGKEICVPGMLSEKELSDTVVTEMFIEDYDCLTSADIGRYIFALCGVLPENFSALSDTEKKEALGKLTEKHWIAKSKLYDILGINRSHTTSAPKKAAAESGKPLSVWLL